MTKDRPKTGHADMEEGDFFKLFTVELRRVLRHLYDPDVLRKSYIMEILPIDSNDSIASLQNHIKKSIEALKPSSTISMQSSAWRIYRILALRYLQQFQQDEVAKSLGLSLRQTRRQDHDALRAIAEYLWTQNDLIEAMKNLSNDALQRSHAVTMEEEYMVQPTSEKDELEWLGQSQPRQTVVIMDLLQTLLVTVEPLRNEVNVRLQLDIGARSLTVMASVTILRQGILVLLTSLLRLIPEGTLQIDPFTTGEQAGLVIRTIPAYGYETLRIDKSREEFAFAQRLIELSGGRMEMGYGKNGQSPDKLQLRFPLVKQVMVLVVDDNEDTLRLYQRYLSDSVFTFYSLKDPEQVMAQVQTLTPQVVILDVMLPGIDGWELLSRLREHPNTQNIPVIISTILPQEQLALTLGAAGFIRKPFNRQYLLQLLYSLSGWSSPEFH